MPNDLVASVLKDIWCKDVDTFVEQKADLRDIYKSFHEDMTRLAENPSVEAAGDLYEEYKNEAFAEALFQFSPDKISSNPKAIARQAEKASKQVDKRLVDYVGEKDAAFTDLYVAIQESIEQIDQGFVRKSEGADQGVVYDRHMLAAVENLQAVVDSFPESQQVVLKEQLGLDFDVESMADYKETLTTQRKIEKGGLPNAADDPRARENVLAKLMEAEKVLNEFVAEQVQGAVQDFQMPQDVQDMNVDKLAGTYKDAQGYAKAFRNSVLGSAGMTMIVPPVGVTLGVATSLGGMASLASSGYSQNRLYQKASQADMRGDVDLIDHPFLAYYYPEIVVGILDRDLEASKQQEQKQEKDAELPLEGVPTLSTDTESSHGNDKFFHGGANIPLKQDFPQQVLDPNQR